MRNDDDAELVQRHRSGAPRAFEALLRRHHARIFRICRSFSPSDEDAADLCQEVFVKAYRSLPSLSRPEAFGAWLGAIARNLGRDSCTARARLPEFRREEQERASPEPSSEDRVLRKEARALSRELLGAMRPGRPQQVATLFYLEELEVPEIARSLDVSVTNVTSALARARTWMRRNLLQRLQELRGYEL